MADGAGRSAKGAHAKRERVSLAPLAWVFAVLAVLLVVGVVDPIYRSHQSKQQTRSAPDSTSIQVAGLLLHNGAYKLGSSEQFQQLKTSAEKCKAWIELTDPQRYGLAFVDPTAVPNCADKKYVSFAADVHEARPKEHYSNQDRYYDFGSPPDKPFFAGYRFECSYITAVVAHNFPANPFPHDDSGQSYTVTPEEEKAFDDWFKRDRYRGEIENLYQVGGYFPDGCYPPAAVFHADGSIEFYPNAPVKSLQDTPSPVFNPDRCNVCDKGAAYYIVPGDTLSSISRCNYGYDDWETIAATNRIINGYLIYAGQTIRLPGLTHTKQCDPDNSG